MANEIRTCRICGNIKQLSEFPFSKGYHMRTCKTCRNIKQAEYRGYRTNKKSIDLSVNGIGYKRYSVPCAHCLTTVKPLKLYRDIDMTLCEDCRAVLDRVCGHIKEMVIA